jgi:hypothetical protein
MALNACVGVSYSTNTKYGCMVAGEMAELLDCPLAAARLETIRTSLKPAQERNTSAPTFPPTKNTVQSARKRQEHGNSQKSMTTYGQSRAQLHPPGTRPQTVNNTHLGAGPSHRHQHAQLSATRCNQQQKKLRRDGSLAHKEHGLPLEGGCGRHGTALCGKE